MVVSDRWSVVGGRWFLPSVILIHFQQWMDWNQEELPAAAGRER